MYPGTPAHLRVSCPRALRYCIRVAASLAFAVVLLASAQARQQNQAPVAVNDTYTLHRSFSQAAPGFLGNDTDPDGDPISLWWNNVGSGPTENGWLGRQADGSFGYTSNYGFAGEDHYVYSVCDNKGACSQATITFIVQNQPPPAASLNLTVHRNVSQGAPGLLGAATDADGDPLSLYYANVGSGPTGNGWLGRAADGGFGYTPDYAFVGVDQFSYTVCDDLGMCTPQTVVFNVVNQPPPIRTPAFNVHRRLEQGAPGLLGSATDNDGDPLSIFWIDVALGPIENGWLGKAADGGFGYTPNQGFVGADHGNYRVCDDLGLCSTYTVTFNVSNGTPTPGNDTYTVGQNKQLVVAAPGFLGNDSDPDGDPIAIQYYTGNVSTWNGSLNFGGDGHFTYSPNPGYTGTDGFDYQVCDDLGLCATAHITFTVEDPCKCSCPPIRRVP